MTEEECQNALDEVKSFLTQFILSILVIFLFLLRDSITKTTYKKECLLGLMLPEVRVYVNHGRKHGSKYGTESVVNRKYSKLQFRCRNG